MQVGTNKKRNRSAKPDKISNKKACANRIYFNFHNAEDLDKGRRTKAASPLIS